MKREEANGARSHLEGLINAPKLTDAALCRAELVWPGSQMRDGTAALHLVLNHAGLDGPGAFHIAASFATYLGRLLDGEAVSEPVVMRDLLNIFSRSWSFSRVPRWVQLAGALAECTHRAGLAKSQLWICCAALANSLLCMPL